MDFDARMNVTSDCNQACGKHRISMWSTRMATMNMDVLTGILMGIANTFEGMDLNDHTVDFRNTYMTCDMRLVVSTIDFRDMYENLIERAGMQLQHDAEFVSYCRRIMSKCKLVDRMMELIEYWDMERLKFEESNTSPRRVKDTFTDEWMKKFRDCPNDLKSIKQMFKPVSMSDLVDESWSLEDDEEEEEEADADWELVA